MAVVSLNVVVVAAGDALIRAVGGGHHRLMLYAGQLAGALDGPRQRRGGAGGEGELFDHGWPPPGWRTTGVGRVVGSAVTGALPTAGWIGQERSLIAVVVSSSQWIQPRPWTDRPAPGAQGMAEPQHLRLAGGRR